MISVLQNTSLKGQDIESLWCRFSGKDFMENIVNSENFVGESMDYSKHIQIFNISQLLAVQKI